MMSKFLRLVKLFEPKVLARLTYPSVFPSEVKAMRHIEEVIKVLKKQDNSGMWFLAYQSRGAPFFWMLLKKYVPKDELARDWYEIAGNGDPKHLFAGVSVSGFDFLRGAQKFVEARILPIENHPNFRYGTFGSWKAKVLSLV